MTKVGLALSGGGIKGAAHIGVLRALQEMGVAVDLVSGTSAGAMAAAMMAAGRSVDEMEAFALSQRPTVLDYDLWGLGRSLVGRVLGKPSQLTGLVKGTRLHRRMVAATRGMQLSQARIPLAITAVDLMSGDTIYFTSQPECRPGLPHCRTITEGSMADAVSASVAIPIVFATRMMHGMQLVDGGVLEYIPVNILYRMGADVVIAVDLGEEEDLTRPVTGLVEVGIQTIRTMERRLVELRTVRARVVIAPDVAELGTFDFESIPLCIEKGYKAAMMSRDWIEYALCSPPGPHDPTVSCARRP